MKTNGKKILTGLAVIVLIASGVTATLGVQKYNATLKAQGVHDYQMNSCDKYSNKENTQTWWECNL